MFGSVPPGELAEEVAVPASELCRIPNRLSFAQAAALPVNYLTAAYGLMELVALRSGPNLLILGAAGGTGTAAIKIGRMLGAHIIAASSTDGKRGLARAQGAAELIDDTAQDWRKTLSLMSQMGY
ncbi:hypothetical protein A1D31_40015 [Bradyrhizobium liaoningense]|nr:hypothetical protein A1D31_40015 [Bradyrhizobium liaoningense]